MEPVKLKAYSNGTVVKFKNRKISVIENKDGDIIIQFRHADKEKDPNTPACEHHCIRGKVRQSTIKVSEVGMEALTVALVEFIKLKAKQKKKKDDNDKVA